jgi:hypothetical protein
MAKCIFLNNPNGTTRTTDVARARNGDTVAGRPEDIKALQVEKFADFKVCWDATQKLESRLDQAFLRNASIQRQAERVTAEEIRLMARELEDALGGKYSILSQDFQLPLIKLVLNNLMKTGEIPKLPREDIRPVITTGMEALGRTHEQARIDQWLAGAVQLFTPQVVSQYISPTEYMSRSGTNYGVDTKGLLLTEDQVAQNQKTAQANQTMQEAIPHIIKGVSDNAQAINQANGVPPVAPTGK